MGFVQQASELADRTREDRNRYADFLRVLALAAVVVGHWLVIDLQLVDALPTGVNVLAESSWTHWGTWVFQVIPLFFLVGGYANSVSWRAHRERGEDWASWLRRRSLRLLWPTAIFVTAGLVLTPIAGAWVDVPEEILSQAGWAVAFILWFLAVYLAVAAITPPGIHAHDCWGLWFVAAILALVITTDALRFLGGIDLFAYLNYAFVWVAFHQIGFAWHDGSLPNQKHLVTMTAVSGLALVALVVWGPYPVSMVGVPGAGVQNTGPPTLALLLFGFTQIGVVLIFRSIVGAWLRRPRVWAAVVGGNLVVMSVFLWHVVPVVALAVSLSAIGITLPGEPGSLTWLTSRPLWIAMLVVLLIPLVLVVGRAERPPDALEDMARHRGRSRLSLALGLVGIAVTTAGLARLTLEGFWAGEPTLIPVWGALAFFAGATVAIGSGRLAAEPNRGVG